MVILAVETVTRAGSLALIDGVAVRAVEGNPSTTHAERLPMEAIDFLARYGRSLHDVDVLAVVTGPGSFTGLRVGIAAVQGLALAGHRLALGVPTLEALAGGWQPEAAEPVLAVACVDGQRGEAFYAAWPRQMGHSFSATTPAILPAVGKPADIAAAISLVRGRMPIVLLGDGGPRYRDVWETLSDLTIVESGKPLAELAATVAMTRTHEAGAPHALRPIYIRRPDAELSRDRARARSRASAEPHAIRRADVARDLAAVEALQQETFTNPWAADAIKWELENTDVARLYVLEAPIGTVVGFCACWAIFDELHINSLAVAPARRRQGLATRLLLHVMSEARADGVTAATLEVRSSNLAARQLYERLGFTVEGVRPDYYQGPREDALILWNRRL